MGLASRSPRIARTATNCCQLFTNASQISAAPTRKVSVPIHVGGPTRRRAKLSGSWHLLERGKRSGRLSEAVREDTQDVGHEEDAGGKQVPVFEEEVLRSLGG